MPSAVRTVLRRHIVASSVLYPYALMCRGLWSEVPKRNLVRSQLISQETKLVIEGFPRSGNTFAVTAFHLCQRRPLTVAHHTHMPGAVIRSCKLKMPTLVVFREPTAAVASLLHFNQMEWTPTTAIDEYVFFYNAIKKWRECYILASFEAVTRDFGRVIAALNNKFGTFFSTFDQTHDHLCAVFSEIDERSREIRGKIEEYSIFASERDLYKRRQAIAATAKSLSSCENLLMATEVFQRLCTQKDL